MITGEISMDDGWGRIRVKGVGGGGLEFKYVSLQKKVF